jgi:hypothetical protein
MDEDIACPHNCETQPASYQDCSSSRRKILCSVQLKGFYVYTNDSDYLLLTLVFLSIFIDLNSVLPLGNVILVPMEAKRKKN